MTTPALLRAFRFAVSLTPGAAGGNGADPEAKPLTGGAFQECSGLTLEADVKDHLEGGRNDSVRRFIGRAKLQPITLKRGMFAATADGYANTELWDWFQSIVAGKYPVRRYDGIIVVRTTYDNSPMAIWNFQSGLPLKVVGPTLNAQTGEVAIEELQIVHEGLTLHSTDPAARGQT